MPKGHCVLIISTIGAFYSKLYNLKEHPNYNDLYEPWSDNKQKAYNHKKELEYQENSSYKLLCDSGLFYARPLKFPTIEMVDNEEIKQISKAGVIQYEDLLSA